MAKLWEEVQLSSAAYLLVGGAALLLLFGAVLAAPYVRRRPLPLPRLRPGGWNGADVLLALLIFQPIVPIFVGVLIAVPLAVLHAAGAAPVPTDREATVGRLVIYLSPLSVALTLGLALPLVRLRSGARPRDYGWTRARGAANVALGAALFLVGAPVTLGVFLLASLVFGPRVHPFEELVRHGFPAWGWAVLVFMTMVGAPLVEETLFRGLLQGWLRRASLRGHVGLMAAVLAIGATPLLYRVLLLGMDPQAALPDEAIDARIAAPCVFAAALVAGYAAALGWLRWRFGPPCTPEAARAHARLAVVGSAMLFGMAHAGWPDPVPLFLLGLGLGWLAYRTQSLVGPVVCHALFNGVACLVLYWGG